MAKEVSQQRREISPTIEREDAIGEAMRAKIGQEAYDLYVQQQCCGGLNFGYFYAGSPIIAYDGAEHPVYSMGRSIRPRFPVVGRRIFGFAIDVHFTTCWAKVLACCDSILPSTCPGLARLRCSAASRFRFST